MGDIDVRPDSGEATNVFIGRSAEEDELGRESVVRQKTGDWRDPFSCLGFHLTDRTDGVRRTDRRTGALRSPGW